MAAGPQAFSSATGRAYAWRRLRSRCQCVWLRQIVSSINWTRRVSRSQCDKMEERVTLRRITEPPQNGSIRNYRVTVEEREQEGSE